MVSKKVLAIGMIAILIVAGAFFLIPGGDAKEAEIIGDVTVTVKEIGTDDEYSATLSIAPPSWTEQMFLTANQDIRETELLDFTQNAGTLKGASRYSIVVASSITLTGNNIASITKNVVKISGAYTSDPQNVILPGTSPSVSKTVWQSDNALVLGETRTVTSDTFQTFKRLIVTDPPVPLTGAHIAKGLTFKVMVEVEGIDGNGKAVSTSVSANLVLTASLGADGSISASITGISSTTTPITTGGSGSTSYTSTASNQGATLNGDRIDGSITTVQISAYAVDDNGQTVVNTATATMKIVVNSYSQSALSVVITGISVGGYTAV